MSRRDDEREQELLLQEYMEDMGLCAARHLRRAKY